jgi:hypothetical protein
LGTAVAEELTQVDCVVTWPVSVEDVDAAGAALESMPKRFGEYCFLEEDGEWRIEFSFETQATTLRDAALTVVADLRRFAVAQLLPGFASSIYTYADGYYTTWGIDRAGELVGTVT